MARIPFEVRDGGRPPTLYEYADCTVCALANASGLDYSVAYILMEQAGRKPRGLANILYGLGQYESELFGTYKTLPGISLFPLTVAQFARQNPTGRFIIRHRVSSIATHVLAVVNGVVINNSEVHNLRARVTAAWQLFPQSNL